MEAKQASIVRSQSYGQGTFSVTSGLSVIERVREGIELQRGHVVEGTVLSEDFDHFGICRHSGHARDGERRARAVRRAGGRAVRHAGL